MPRKWDPEADVSLFFLNLMVVILYRAWAQHFHIIGFNIDVLKLGPSDMDQTSNLSIFGVNDDTQYVSQSRTV